MSNFFAIIVGVSAFSFPPSFPDPTFFFFLYFFFLLRQNLTKNKPFPFFRS